MKLLRILLLNQITNDMNAKQLKELRQSLGLTQEKMSERMGITSRAYQYKEAGGTITKRDRIILEQIKKG